MRPELSADGDGQSFLLWGVELLGLYRSVNIRSKNARLLNLPDDGYFANSRKTAFSETETHLKSVVPEKDALVLFTDLPPTE
jgi:hypothetical protein